MRKKPKKGAISRRLGIPVASRLTDTIIRKKIAILTAGIKNDSYSEKMRPYAIYYRNWYRYRLKNGPRREKTTARPRRAKRPSAS